MRDRARADACGPASGSKFRTRAGNENKCGRGSRGIDKEKAASANRLDGLRWSKTSAPRHLPGNSHAPDDAGNRGFARRRALPVSVDEKPNRSGTGHSSEVTARNRSGTGHSSEGMAARKSGDIRYGPP